MSRYRISIDGIMSDVYEPTAPSRNSVALFLYGFPASIGENVVTERLTESGYHVVVPHYPGTYDSDGAFTPRNCLEMIVKLSAALTTVEHINLKNMKKAKLPPSVSTIVGYSFGAFIAIEACRQFEGCTRLLLVSPALTYGAATIDMGFSEEGPEFLDYLARTRPHTYRLGDRKEWGRFYTGHYNAAPDRLLTRAVNVEAYVGELDGSISFGTLQANFPAFLAAQIGAGAVGNVLMTSNAGHSLSDVMGNDQLSSMRTLIEQF